MILVDADDAKSQQQPAADDDAVQPPGLDGGRFGSVRPQPPTAVLLPGPPPSYSSYHTPSRLPPSPPPSYPKLPSSHHHPAPPVPAAVQQPRRPSPARRFWRAFAVALVLYLALVSLTRTLVHMASGGFHANDHSAGAPRPEDGRVLESVGHRNWTSHQPSPQWAPRFPNSAETSFTLPVESRELYLISRGSYQFGKVQVRQSNAQGEQVRVDVRVAYHHQRALERGTVCRLHKGGNRNGVGIYTPESGWSDSTRDQLLFDVVITFPAAPSPNAPLGIHKFTLLTNKFAYDIGDVWESMVFEDVELATSNSPIRASSITLARGSVTSSNGAISGHFNASVALKLSTSNAPIRASASLFNEGRDPTKLDVRTSNSPIESTVWLATESGSGGNFVVKVHSSNGPIGLRYEDAPQRARLVSEVVTSNAATTVGMHPTFEGEYVVSTSNSEAAVRDTHPRDPTGQGRRRDISRAPSSSRNKVSGYVYWGGRVRRGGEGTCKVHTSNGRASLDL